MSFQLKYFKATFTAVISWQFYSREEENSCFIKYLLCSKQLQKKLRRGISSRCMPLVCDAVIPRHSSQHSPGRTGGG